MNEEKKKIFKLSYIFIALAIIFAIFGFFDLKSNAAELPYFRYTVNSCDVNPDYDLFSGLKYTDYTGTSYDLNLNSDYKYAFNRRVIEKNDGSRLIYMYLYYVDTVNPDGVHLVTCSNTESDDFPLHYYDVTYTGVGSSVGKWPIYKYTLGEWKLYDGLDVYKNDSFLGSYSFYDIPSSANSVIYNQTYTTNILVFNDDYNALENYLLNGVVENIVIDYDNLPVDDDMPIVENLMFNSIDLSENTLLSSSPDAYDYVTWTNTTDAYPIQIDCCVGLLKHKGKTLTEERYIDWYNWKITDEYINSFTKKRSGIENDSQMDDEWLSKNLSYVVKTLTEGISLTTDYSYAFGYRVRYIDTINRVAGPWVVLLPGATKNTYDSYIVGSDGYMNLIGDSTGSIETFDPEDTSLEGATATIDKKNEAKDTVEDSGFLVVGNDMDTSDAVSWLNAVISFIKSTPSLVKSVMSFLPSTILYGLYAIIFLGVIAAAWAIVKALI